MNDEGLREQIARALHVSDDFRCPDGWDRCPMREAFLHRADAVLPALADALADAEKWRTVEAIMDHLPGAAAWQIRRAIDGDES